MGPGDLAGPVGMARWPKLSRERREVTKLIPSDWWWLEPWNLIRLSICWECHHLNWLSEGAEWFDDKPMGIWGTLFADKAMFWKDRAWEWLVGGLDTWMDYVSIQLGIIIPTDCHISQRGRYTTNQIISHHYAWNIDEHDPWMHSFCDCLWLDVILRWVMNSVAIYYLLMNQGLTN